MIRSTLFWLGLSLLASKRGLFGPVRRAADSQARTSSIPMHAGPFGPISHGGWEFRFDAQDQGASGLGKTRTAVFRTARIVGPLPWESELRNPP